jgi:NMD protein affecting ribosome stability and mRNA decay
MSWNSISACRRCSATVAEAIEAVVAVRHHARHHGRVVVLEPGATSR